MGIDVDYKDRNNLPPIDYKSFGDLLDFDYPFPIITTRDPLPSDTTWDDDGIPIGTLWVNKDSNDLFMLVTYHYKEAQWKPLNEVEEYLNQQKKGKECANSVI